MRSQRNRRGAAMILSLLFLVLCGSLAAAMISSTTLELKKSDNLAQAHKAQLAAESGLEFHSHTLKGLQLAPSLSGHEMLGDLASALQATLGGTRNLGDCAVTCDGTNIAIPSITMADGLTFRATLSLMDSTRVRLAVVGTCAGNSGTPISRTLALEFQTGAKSPTLDYGVYSKGPITIENNFDYRGANSPEEASLYTEAQSGYAVSIGMNGLVEGDIDLKHEYGMVSLGTNTTVGGSVNVGVPPSPFPEVDGSVFTGFATNIMTPSTPVQNVTLTNLRIPANTNPEFGNNVTLRGVIYIEAPNYVYFKNNVIVEGVIVAEDPGSSGGTNKIEFKNNLDITGVETLPNTPEFTELRKLTGSAILAPGFDIEFKNNFGTMSGTIACEQLILKNNLAATVRGAIIIYGTGGLTFKNNASITVDRSSIEGLPSGLDAPGATIFIVNPDTYQELR